MNQAAAGRWLGRASVGRRLGFAFAALVLLIIFMGALGYSRLGSLTAVTERIVAVDTRTERVLREWHAETKANSVRALVLTRSEDADIKRLLTPPLQAATKRISELQKQVEDLLRTEEAKALFSDIGAKRKIYLDARNTAIERKTAGKLDEAVQIVDSAMVPAIDKYVASIQKLVDYQVQLAEVSATEAAASSNSGRNTLVAACAAGVLLGIFLAWRITISITGPLRQAMGVAAALAKGELTLQIEVRSKDELGQLLSALGHTVSQLRDIIRGVRESTGAISIATKEIAAGNSDLSQRTEEQASSLEETASSMEELTSTVQQNALNAQQANQLALGASAVAVQGGTVVGQVVETMSSINASSKKIVDITGVIDGIAFQTNILALNAAVEAARAGEQGRGFAVVASEVRNLAQRSAAAAKEIKALIGDSVAKVDTGTRLVDDAGKTMQEIVASVKRVTDIMGEITAASQEQSAGIEQVNQAITQMDQVTQQNAALVEEAAAAAEAVEQQARNLDRAMAVFKVGKAAAGAASGRDAAESQEAGARPAADRRGPNCARNVARLPARSAKVQGPVPMLKAAAAGGGADQWEEF